MKTLFLSLLTVTFLFAGNAFADESMAKENAVLGCGIPVETPMETEVHYKACNVYDRQLVYAEETRKFRSKLKERQRNFAEPSKALKEQYKANLEKYYDALAAETKAEAEAAAAAEAEAMARAEAELE